VSEQLQLEYEYTVTRARPGYIYSDKVHEVKSVEIGNSIDVATDIGRFSVKVSDAGFVAVSSSMHTEFRVNDASSKSGSVPPRRLEVVDMPTGGQGLRAMLRDGDTIAVGLDKNGMPLEKLKVKYTSNGVKLCRNALQCKEVKEGQKVVIGRGELGLTADYISREHIEVEVRREYVNGKLQLVAYARDLGSANGSAVYGQDGVYVLYTSRTDEKGPVAGIPPRSYGIRTPHEVDVYVGNIHVRLPHAAPTKQTVAVKV